jgi:hypothetical protein
MRHEVSSVNWDAIGAVAEALAALAVIASLIYLAVQLKAANRNSMSAALQTLATKSQDRLLAVASNPELASAIGQIGGELSDTEKVQVQFFLLALIQDLHDQHRQFELGLVPETILFGSLRRVQTLDTQLQMFSVLRPSLEENWTPSFKAWFSRHYDEDA